MRGEALLFWVTGIKWKENRNCDLDSRQLYAGATDLTTCGFVRNDSKLLNSRTENKEEKTPHCSIAVSSHLSSLSVSHTLRSTALFKAECVNDQKGVGASHNDGVLQREVRQL